MSRKGPSFKIIAIDVLARIKSDWAKAIIEKYLNNFDRGVRIAARRALSCF